MAHRQMCLSLLIMTKSNPFVSTALFHQHVLHIKSPTLCYYANVYTIPLLLCFVFAEETLQTTTLKALEVGSGSTDSDDVIERVCEERKGLH